MDNRKDNSRPKPTRSHVRHREQITRRQMLARAGGLTALAACGGSHATVAAVADDAQSTGALPHFAATAKRVIYLYQAGAPSQLDMFDHRPALARWHGKPLPDSVRGGQRFTEQTAEQESFPIAASKFKFKQHGESGAWVSELLPHLSGVVDEVCFVKSMHTEAINHETGTSFLLTGSERAGWPSIAGWLSYGLGSLNDNLPASAVMISLGTALGSGGQPVLDRYWGNGFLPSRFRAVKFRSKGDPVLYLTNPNGLDANVRGQMLRAITQLNQQQFDQFADPEILSRSHQYDMATRMQRAVPELTDLSREPKSTFELYGDDARRPGTYAANCLLARRMAERGMRFIQLCHRGWDAHSNVNREVPLQCGDVDRGSAALIKDLRQRGMLDDTLVVFGAEFGRTVYSQGDLASADYGRDHHPRCFTVWLAGGGIKGGQTHGETDELGYNVASNPVHVHDLNATILHCLGIDHRRFTYRFQGRDYRLTNVAGSVQRSLLK